MSSVHLQLKPDDWRDKPSADRFHWLEEVAFTFWTDRIVTAPPIAEWLWGERRAKRLRICFSKTAHSLPFGGVLQEPIFGRRNAGHSPANTSDHLTAKQRVEMEIAQAWALYLNGGGGEPRYFDFITWSRMQQSRER
jgi:hypothetical protein